MTFKQWVLAHSKCEEGILWAADKERQFDPARCWADASPFHLEWATRELDPELHIVVKAFLGLELRAAQSTDDHEGTPALHLRLADCVRAMITWEHAVELLKAAGVDTP